ncbi:hypothetical protein MKEN_00086700 [Mycena kentingensis (nom. inval.)]|nr:hypothetical protein MKEN_00086700 [Mycena kentingensis (nom. inval.)]
MALASSSSHPKPPPPPHPPTFNPSAQRHNLKRRWTDLYAAPRPSPSPTDATLKHTVPAAKKGRGKDKAGLNTVEAHPFLNCASCGSNASGRWWDVWIASAICVFCNSCHGRLLSLHAQTNWSQPRLPNTRPLSALSAKPRCNDCNSSETRMWWGFLDSFSRYCEKCAAVKVKTVNGLIACVPRKDEKPFLSRPSNHRPPSPEKPRPGLTSPSKPRLSPSKAVDLAASGSSILARSLSTGEWMGERSPGKDYSFERPQESSATNSVDLILKRAEALPMFSKPDRPHRPSPSSRRIQSQSSAPNSRGVGSPASVRSQPMPAKLIQTTSNLPVLDSQTTKYRPSLSEPPSASLAAPRIAPTSSSHKDEWPIPMDTPRGSAVIQPLASKSQSKLNGALDTKASSRSDPHAAERSVPSPATTPPGTISISKPSADSRSVHGTKSQVLDSGKPTPAPLLIAAAMEQQEPLAQPRMRYECAYVRCGVMYMTVGGLEIHRHKHGH